MEQIKVSKNFFQPKSSYEQFAMQVYNLLVENFSQTFFVGGMVRNLFWDKPVIDIDIATSANPNQVKKILVEAGYTVDTSGLKFGVVKIKRKSYVVEVATLRKESYHNSRYPEVTWTKSISQDSKRRDFTINSLYFNAKTNIVIDAQNALPDIKQKRLRTIGKPGIRFREDPLRIIRATRFIKQYNLSVESKTKLALENNLELVEKFNTFKN